MLKLSFKTGKDVEPIKTQVFNNTLTKVTLSGKLNCDVFPNFNVYYSALDKSPFVNEESPDIVWAEGIAKKSPNDSFDKVIGYRIAEARAKIKLYKFMKNLAFEYAKVYNAYVYGKKAPLFPDRFEEDGYMADYYKYANLVKREKNHLNALINGTDTKGTE